MKTTLALTLIALSTLAHANGPTTDKFEVIDRFKIGGEGGWDYLSLEPNSRRLFVSRSTRIDVINIDTGKKVGEVTNLKGTHQAVFATKLNRGFTSNGGDSTVTIFNLKTYAEIGRVKVGERPDAIVFDPSSKRVFTFNAASEDSTAIDAATGKVLGSVKLGGRPEFPVADGKGNIFVNIESKSEIFEFNARTLEGVKRWSLAPAEGPSGLAMDTRHRRLFAVTDGKMIISDADGGKVVTTVPIGQGPDAAVFDPALGLAFSSNGAGTITVVSEDGKDKYSVVQTVETQRGARTCALDPKTHRIFLAVAESKPGDGTSRRRQMVPGTFAIIVVGRK